LSFVFEIFCHFVLHFMLLLFTVIKSVDGQYMDFICQINYVNYLSRVGVTYKMGCGLDDWIYCTFSTYNLGVQVVQRHC
jgi:hypothetical protein